MAKDNLFLLYFADTGLDGRCEGFYIDDIHSGHVVWEIDMEQIEQDQNADTHECEDVDKFRQQRYKAFLYKLEN